MTSTRTASRFLASLFVALLAYCIADRAGFEFWGEPGDRADMAVLSFLATWFTIAALRSKENPA